MKVLGIDIRHSGLKGCVVDTAEGKMLSDCISTPPLEETIPHKVLAQLHQVVNKEFQWEGPVGCAFPAPVHRGIVLSTKRIHESWVDANTEQLFSEITDNPVSVINDTDATGLAEMQFGAGQHQEGLTIVLTINSGMGSSLFFNGQLIPNTELGFIEIQGTTAAEHATNTVRKKDVLRQESWTSRLQIVLDNFEKIFHPRLFILCGQLSSPPPKVFPFIKINTPLKAASFPGEAKIVGAAMAAARGSSRPAYPPNT
ncbi:ROK family protein [Fodinibius sediminis]|uniref:Polyphosphate glucokinase n=1 Tax=Fodinibius sediminis TaxID=1214077 RepID=A0A521AEQ3_9BACT|nr:ROK family protein [Fodinibius sediminis]SMO33271.1 polyphosphate glucokinase [Fodinibius sediminis]